jgi:hypothetical protein
MKLLTEYFELQKKVHDYFGYVEDWVAIPLDDGTNYFWKIDENEHGGGSVRFAEDIETLQNSWMAPWGNNGDEVEVGDYYENIIYTQRFLPKWIYRGEDYTMICVDTRTDGNKFLQVFDNTKEIK